MELARLKKEIAELKMKKEILKKSRGILCKRVAIRYAFIKQMRLICAMYYLYQKVATMDG